MMACVITWDKKMLYVFARKNKAGGVDITMPSDKPLSTASHFCTFDKFRSDKPDYRNKWITLNCYRYAIMWDKR